MILIGVLWPRESPGIGWYGLSAGRRSCLETSLARSSGEGTLCCMASLRAGLVSSLWH
jgi:hypothetical protein